MIAIIFLCTKNITYIGFRGDDKRDDTFSYSRPETRCGCSARVKISLRNGLYDVYDFEASHNHILAPGTMAHFLRS
jgi:zinc finger SWIM domain-containing protein 3